jgi:dTDP-4-amino-4,6-dideoxygalactose transaminase
MTAVPFGDLKAHVSALRPEIDAAVARVLDSGWFILGPEGEAFEKDLAASLQARQAVAVANGTEAIQLALEALGLAAGDEVITSPLTAAFTALAILRAGARPVFADVDPVTLNVSPETVARALTPHTRALLPVHLYGHPVDLDPMIEMARERGIPLVEDACQAIGAQYKGRPVGVLSGIGALSFYPTKNLGAFGDAGAVVTDEEEHARRIRALREHGQVRKYEHELAGYTSRLDTLQAIVLLHKLPLLERWNEERRAIARKYDEALADVGDLWLPPVPHDSEPVWHLYVVRTAAPDELAAFLAERGVATGRHYPQPIHLAPAFAELGYPEGSFPVAEAIARECLSLPVFPGMSEGQIGSVVAGVDAYFHDG